MNRSLVCLALIVSLASAARADEIPDVSQESADQSQGVNDGPGYVRLVGFVACAAVAASVCSLSFDHEPRAKPFREWGGWVSWKVNQASPGDNLSTSPNNVYYQHAELSAYTGNLALDYSLRATLPASGGPQSQSFRAGYAYFFGTARLGIGAGYRKNDNTVRGDAFELWFPIYLEPSKTSKFPLNFTFQNTWAIRSKSLRWEIMLGAGVRIFENVTLDASADFFSDYPNSNFALEFGPRISF